MTRLPGISGTLFPTQYLASGFTTDFPPDEASSIARRLRHMARWWHQASETCGPATGLRALFDLVAMPLFGMLGFRAHDAIFDRRQATAWLSTARGTPVALVLLPWAERPSTLWRDLASTARHAGADWAFLLAPPYLAIVDARGYATRRDVEFTLPAILDPQSFVRFWALTRAEAFEAVTAAGDRQPARIDAIVARGFAFQAGVGEDLQVGVAESLAVLGSAIAAARREASRPRQGARPDTHLAAPPRPLDEALTIVYRILFLLFVESRELVPVRVPVYGNAYALGTLGREARAVDAAGLWEGLAAVTRLSRAGCQTDELIVRPFNGRLFARAAAPLLEKLMPPAGRAARALDTAARRALIALASRPGAAGREEINYADLGVEQLGAVYERVLDLDVPPDRVVPAVLPRGPSAVRARHSARRKQTGTFYTPRALAEFVVRRTLSPLVAGASADAILRLRVVDPAMGSGAFLVAACRFLAAAYERALVEEGRLTPGDLDNETRADLRRLVAERCLAGVDLNPIAVQLARLSLWLATLAHGKPLTFLDHRLRVGDSLIGASPSDLSRLPSRRRPQSQPLPLFADDLLERSLQRAIEPLRTIAARRDDDVADVRLKERLWNAVVSERSALHAWRQAATLWCARWFWPAGEAAPGPAEMRALVDATLRADATLTARHVAGRLATAATIGRQLSCFHWPLEFPDVFSDRDGAPLEDPGFDAVIGNPPWEMLRGGPDEGERSRQAAANLVRFVRESGLFPSCDRGHLNLYQPFLDRALTLARRNGRVGLVLPWGLAVDDGARLLRTRLFDESDVDTLVGLDNAAGLFPIHRGLRFVVVTTTSGRPTGEVRARFGVRTSDELDALPGQTDAAGRPPGEIRLTPRLIRRVGGGSARIPDVRRPEELRLLERLVTRFPTLGSRSGGAVTFGRDLNATEDRRHLGSHGLPVIEGKHLSPFQVDLGSPAGYVERRRAGHLFPDARFDRPRLAYRDVSGASNRLTLIAAVIPAGTLTTHTVFCARSPLPLVQQHFLCALFNSYVLNALVRLLMGSHLTTSLVEALPVPMWTGARVERRIARLAGRLARSSGSAAVRAAIQADAARLYGLDRDEFERVLEGFPLVDPGERARAARAFAGRGRLDATC